MPSGNPARHTISRADELYRGDLFFAPYSPDGRAGVKISHLYKYNLGAPAASASTGLVNAATSTELPNAATKTYTPATDGTSPLDASTRASTATITVNGTDVLVYKFDVPRNASLNVTHASSIVAISVTISGYDEYFQAMTETLAVTATGTTKTSAGAKAWKYIKSIAITSASDATADTLNLGWANVFGLPIAAPTLDAIVATTADGVIDSPTLVKQDQTTATATTGDVRGTVAFTTSPNGTHRFSVVLEVPVQYDTPSGLTAKQAVFGVDQA